MVGLLPLAAVAEDGNDIELAAYYGGNYVLLRWYPQSIEVYQKCKAKGYVVERKLGNEGWQTLSTVKPAPFATFSELQKKNKKAFLGSYILYPEETAKLEEQTLNEGDVLEEDSTGTDDDAADYATSESQDYLYKMSLVSCEFSVDLAKAMALNYSDEFVNTQQQYEYRVRPADDNLKYKCATIKVSTVRPQKLPAMSTIACDNTDYRTYISWNTSKLDNDYSGYQLERSSDGKNYEVVNEEPIVQMYDEGHETDVITYRDSLPDCGRTYYYRVSGISRFGMQGPYSNVATAQYECPFNVQVNLEEVTINPQNVATLKWSVKNPDNQAIKSFDVQRAEMVNAKGGEFVSLLNGKRLSGSARSYTDKHPLQSNYYRVVAYGKGKNDVTCSNFYYAHPIDSVPPAAPTGLKGTIDSLGIVKLTWKENDDDDIMAYRVFFSNDSLGQYIGASDTFLTTPYYTDTLYLGSLTNDIYYKVLAIDRNYNQGPLSEAIKLVKPDTIPPSPSRFTEIHQDEAGTIHVSWQRSTSTDIASQTLTRRVGDLGEWKEVAKWPGKNIPETFVDTFPAKGERFYYHLTVTDESGNKTESDAAPFKSKNIKQECVKNVELATNYKKGGVEITWDKCGCRISKTNIFRKGEDGKSKLIVTLKGVEHYYFDNTVKKGEQYQYIIQPVTDKMSKVAKSEEFRF